MANHQSSHYPDIGVLGEDFIAQWLQSDGWQILHRRWRCPWGEIDLIANNCASLAFVEVKTRRARSWDAGGLLAITPQKQSKIWKTAGCFLATYPEFGDYACRFDVALVHCEKRSFDPKYNLSLLEYIPAAF